MDQLSVTASLIDIKSQSKFTASGKIIKSPVEAEIKWGKDTVELYEIGGVFRHGTELTLAGGREGCPFKGVVFQFLSEVTAAVWMAHLTKRGVMTLPTAMGDPMPMLIEPGEYSLGRKGMKFQVRPGK